MNLEKNMTKLDGVKETNFPGTSKNTKLGSGTEKDLNLAEGSLSQTKTRKSRKSRKSRGRKKSATQLAETKDLKKIQPIDKKLNEPLSKDNVATRRCTWSFNGAGALSESHINPWAKAAAHVHKYDYASYFNFFKVSIIYEFMQNTNFNSFDDEYHEMIVRSNNVKAISDTEAEQLENYFMKLDILQAEKKFHENQLTEKFKEGELARKQLKEELERKTKQHSKDEEKQNDVMATFKKEKIPKGMKIKNKI